VWRTKIGQTKTAESEAPVPLVPILHEILTNYRSSLKRYNEDSDYIFAGDRRGQPLNLMNVALREIRPKLEKHKLRWKGWHSFRRGLATNLHSLGIKPMVIAAILRHSDISTTLSYYVSVPDAETQDAMKRLQEVVWTANVLANE
jgi:integrase